MNGAFRLCEVKLLSASETRNFPEIMDGMQFELD